MVGVGEHTVYPIFRVGSTTLLSAADRRYMNQEISRCEHIDILLRDPSERFVSGLNAYCLMHNLDVDVARQQVEQGKLIDRHFIPQYFWLLHLYKFYEGVVTLRPFDYIKNITKVHKKVWQRKKDQQKKKSVVPLKSFVEVDYQLMKSVGQSSNLGEIIRKYKNVLS